MARPTPSELTYQQMLEDPMILKVARAGRFMNTEEDLRKLCEQTDPKINARTSRSL